ncbi:MAG: LTA synthase family protein, partial [Spirochaetaceae bacterium]|nr:LTA synthase family protein [Spirochaetaceae bacterium]
VIPVMFKLTIGAFYRLGYFSSENILHDSFSRRNFKYGTIFAQIYDIGIDQQEFIEKIEYGDPVYFPAKSKLYNIVSIQVESFNADLINYSYNGREVTPNLNRIARNNIYFPYLLAQHKTGNSSDAEFSVFNSVEALSGFPAAQFTEYDYPNSFVKQLSEFSELAFHGNKGDFYNRYENLEKMGFDRFWDRIRMDLPEKGWGAADEDVFNFMLEKINKETIPFYYHHITMTSHGPFENSKNYYNNPNYSDIQNNSERNYLNTFSYVDETISNFIISVRERHPDTYFFIYGDHTVNIEGNDYKSNVRNIENDFLFEYVPLIIITPENIQYLEEKRIVSFLDLAPTILSASGQESQIKTFGEIIIPTDGELILRKDILFNDEYYSREELFNLIKNGKTL